jgi:hypothetical protein
MVELIWKSQECLFEEVDVGAGVHARAQPCHCE